MRYPLIGGELSEQITIVVRQQSYTVGREDPRFSKVIELVKRSKDEDVEEELVEALNMTFGPKAIAEMGEHFKMTEDGIFYKGHKLKGIIIDKIYEAYSTSMPYEPILRFLENLYENPNHEVIQMLWQFLEHDHLPITEDGHFLGYKGVDANFYSKQAGPKGKIRNMPGDKPAEPREEVVDNPDVACDRGLHVGSERYARSWAGSDGKVVCVKVNPRDCVSVPHDCDHEKLRCCTYEVMYEVPGTMKGFYDAAGNPMPTAANEHNWQRFNDEMNENDSELEEDYDSDIDSEYEDDDDF